MNYKPLDNEIAGILNETAFIVSPLDLMLSGHGYQTPMLIGDRLNGFRSQLPCVCVVDPVEGNYCLNDWTSCLWNDGYNNCDIKIIEEE